MVGAFNQSNNSLFQLLEMHLCGYSLDYGFGFWLYISIQDHLALCWAWWQAPHILAHLASLNILCDYIVILCDFVERLGCIITLNGIT